MNRCLYLVRILFAGGVLLGGLLVSESSAQTQSRADFCAGWHKLCLSFCKGGAGCTNDCNNRLSNCGRNGCYHFVDPGPRCQGEAMTCSLRLRECIIVGNRQFPTMTADVKRNCETAKDFCMKAGRWVGPSGIDYGPAEKR